MKRAIFLLISALFFFTATSQVRIGLFTDCQYKSTDSPGSSRNYPKSKQKLIEAINTYNSQNLAFVVSLGDLVDNGYDNFDTISSIANTIRHKTHYVLGNHDYYVGNGNLKKSFKRLGIKRTYYDFSEGGFHFVILDGGELNVFAQNKSLKALEVQTVRDSLIKAGAINGENWNGGISSEQLRWLDKSLAGAQARGEKSIIMCHYPLLPAPAVTNLWNNDKVLDIISRSPSVVAYFNGHDHRGAYQERDGVHYIMFTGMVEKEENRYYIIELYPEKMNIIGYGDAKSYELKFKN